MTTPSEKYLTSYWFDMYQKYIDKQECVVICDWKHYTIYPPNNIMKGHGGDNFKIVRIDGTITYTENMWYQGRIPEYMRYLFSNNALSIDRC